MQAIMARSPLIWAILLTSPVAALGASTLHTFDHVAISPDGRLVASIESEDDGSNRDLPAFVKIRDFHGGFVNVDLPCESGRNCVVDSLTWDGRGDLNFIVSHADDGTAEIDAVGLKGGAARKVLTFQGTLTGLRLGPNDRLAVLATAQAHKSVGRAEAGAPQVGDIGGESDEQRIALVEGGALDFASPPDLYVYEFDFLPDGGFVGDAAPGDGDSQWWVAKMYVFEHSQARVVFTPGPREQLASPVASPDGKTLAFIGGWMSDFGSTGGDAYLLRLDQPGAVPRNLTDPSHATVTALYWNCGEGLTGLMLAGDTWSVARLDKPVSKPIWSGHDVLNVSKEQIGLSCGTHGTATVSSGFNAPPEIMAGPVGRWRKITHENASVTKDDVNVQSLTWRSDGFDVQGWLLKPAGGDPGLKRPLVVLVHGGPQAVAANHFLPPSNIARLLLDAGWDVLEPNYRGSFGQGEAFAAASIKDLGGGDWRDVLAGVDAAEHSAPIDDARVGITGGSYGGYLAMWAVTQTSRFRAAAAHAGVSDWLSIEGEAPQAGSDEVNFGGSVYDDPAPYLKASPIMYMRRVKTPMLLTVGERDLECPAPQSLEFYTALEALGVPVEFHVYAAEGHHLKDPANRADFETRTIGWFQRWFAATASH